MANVQVDHYHVNDVRALSLCRPPAQAGLYATSAARTPLSILDQVGVKPDTARLLYIDEADNLAGLSFASHHARWRWELKLAVGETLAAATCVMPGSTPEHRDAVKRALIESLRPPCNV